MKPIVLSVMLLCRLVSARAEDWGMRYEYTDPSERNWFGNLMPIGGEMPFYFKGVQTQWIKFRGCEFWPDWLGREFHAEKNPRYGPVLTLRGYEGMLICFPELTSLGPASNESMPIKPGVGIGFSVRWRIGRLAK